MSLDVKQSQVPILAPSLTGCVALGKVLKLFEP